MEKKHGFKLGGDPFTYMGTENVRLGVLESQPRFCQGLSDRRASSTYKCVSIWNWQYHRLPRQESNYSIATAMQILPLKLNYKFDLCKSVITMLTTALPRNEVRAAAIPRQINHETGDNIIFFFHFQTQVDLYSLKVSPYDPVPIFWVMQGPRNPLNPFSFFFFFKALLTGKSKWSGWIFIAWMMRKQEQGFPSALLHRGLSLWLAGHITTQHRAQGPFPLTDWFSLAVAWLPYY